MTDRSMVRVVIESPFRGKSKEDRDDNLRYLRACIRDSVSRGESPYASHQMLPGALDEDVPEERDLGIEVGYAWWKVADRIVFYTDRGWSGGMVQALRRCKERSKPFEIRLLGAAPVWETNNENTEHIHERKER